MKRLILVRHSIPDIRPAEPAATWALSQEGRERAAALAPILEPYAPQIIVSSDEPKARETATILAQALGLPVREERGLREHDRHGVPFTTQAAFQQAVRRTFAQPDALVFGNETANEAQMRFRRAIQRICEQQPEETIVLVSHGTVMSLYLSTIGNLPLYPLWLSLDMPAFAVVALPAMQIEHIEATPID